MAEALRVGIAGLGTVGASVARLLATKASELTRQCGRDIVVTAVSARSRGRDRGVDLSAATWFDDPVDLAKSASIDVFVELIGGDEGPARASVKAALEAGRHVVTANKALLAKHGGIQCDQLQIGSRCDIEVTTQFGLVPGGKILHRAMHMHHHFHHRISILRIKLHIIQEILGNTGERIRGPVNEPVNGTAIDERRELTQPVAECVTDGTHTQHKV